MKSTLLRSGVAAVTLGAVLFSATGLPAQASTTTTRNIIYGAAAAAAAITLYNVVHKDQLASSVQGYLPDGSTVYADGHVVTPNGQTWYPGNQGERVACSNQYCTIQGAYTNNGYGNGYGYTNNGYGYQSRNRRDGRNGGDRDDSNRQGPGRQRH
jgi:hypothetical protein